MEHDRYVAAVRNWLAEPAQNSGIHLADEADGWTYRSYRDLADTTWSIAALMREHGMSSGDGVCVIMPTGFPCAAAFYAVWACGGVFTPVAPPMFGDLDQIVAHIAAILAQARPRLVVTSTEFEQLVRRAAIEAGRADEPLVINAQTLGPAPAVREFGEPDECALLQFTSGSTGTPRGVRVSWRNLANNIAMISTLIDWRPGESLVSWLPLYHDMGLVGAFLTTVTNQGDLYLMRPDQFVRDPARWLRAMTHAQHSPSPSFALGYVAHRVPPEDIAELDLSGWRTLAVGSEPVEVADLQSFANLAGGQGFSTNAYTLAYGLAEATLMVTSSARNRPLTALRVDNPNLRFGARVTILDERLLDDTHRVEGAGWITGLGYSTPESTVTVVDEDGRELPDGTLGEMVVVGDSVALGYSASGEPAAGSSTRIADGRLYTGDAGFLYRGEVFVLGRMGSSLKVRGRSVFMEDIESRVAQETGITKGKLAAVTITEAGAQGIALFAESAPGDWIPEARRIIRGELGPAQSVTIVTGPRGTIRRTSSGKPRRRHMWQLFRDGVLDGVIAHEADGTAASIAAAAVVSDNATEAGAQRVGPVAPEPTLPADRVRQLLDRALETVAIPRDSTVLFEGSLAEGFGNEGSDVDFLVLAPGDEEMPTLPTVLFIDGRRVEVRTRSQAQLRRQVERVAGAEKPTELDEDLLNRCQRFLRATVVRAGTPDVVELRSLLPYSSFTALMADWWTARATQALRFAVALRALEARAEAGGWARDGLLQAMKGWAARRGESYLETKWLPQQLDRIGSDELIDRYRDASDPATWAFDDPARSFGDTGPGVPGDPQARALAEQLTWEQVWELATALGVHAVVDDPHQVLFARRPRVTTWTIGGRVHVIRDDRDVFVLSDRAAPAWRSVVFRHSVRDVLARAESDIATELAEFVRLGLVGLQWRGDELIEPALAMCKPVRPFTPVPSALTPALGVTGAARDDQIATLSPLPATRFTECALNLVWSNIVLENAREDLAGAVKNSQGAVADIAAHRLIAMGIRVVLSAFGIHPLPADVAPAETVRRILPPHALRRDELLTQLESAQQVCFSDSLRTSGDTIAGLEVLDDFVAQVRRIAGGVDLSSDLQAVATTSATGFPASFDSREQWRRTLAIGYDWLRIAGYLNTDLPLDEARDLLASGGHQPHLREGESA
ncbi:AMP-binding protein [Nocardia sp. GCM10030253]|uniref:AMP-binding protein n=1 Tax=Nocardia sp. GCM10030253 TaxID=3273404 RepID=UPI00363ABCC6